MWLTIKKEDEVEEDIDVGDVDLAITVHVANGRIDIVHGKVRPIGQEIMAVNDLGLFTAIID